MKATVRWIIFLAIGLPFQFVVYTLYPLVVLYWRLFIYKVQNKTAVAHQQFPPNSFTSVNAIGLLDNDDTHNALTMFGALDSSHLDLLLDYRGNFVRRVNENLSLNMTEVSGDCVTTWCFAVTDVQDDTATKSAVLRAANQYLKYLGSQSFDSINNGDVSNRCNNVGLNYCPDGRFYLGQPATGPQFYTSSALFALASKYSFKFKIVFWLHWLLLGGWYWAWVPMIYPDLDSWWYVRDITMKNLYVHKFVFGNRWWIRKPMEFINNKLMVHENDLFNAMLGIDPPSDLPDALDGFFSQKKVPASTASNDMNGYFGQAIRRLAKQARGE